MLDARHTKSLSSEDALWLYLEQKGKPLNIAATCIFEGFIPLDLCTRYIESKLPQIPQFLQRLVSPPLNLGLPTWQPDPRFNIQNHVREITLERGTEAEFKEVVGEMIGSNLDFRRPLWDLTLVHGLKGNRTGLIVRIHHCLADGTSGVVVMETLLGVSPICPELPKRKVKIQAPPLQRKSLLEGLLDSCFTVVERSVDVHFRLFEMAQGAVAAAPKALSGNGGGLDIASAAEIIGEFAKFPCKLPFNVMGKGRQVYDWAEIPLDQIKAFKGVCGVTVNDVVLTLITDVIRRYAELHGRNVEGRALHILVPIKMRSKDDTEIGNKVGNLPLSVPLDIRDPIKLLFAVRKAIALSRKARASEIIGFLGTLVGAVPTPLQAALLPQFIELPVPLANPAVTNVPGPQSPLYLLGHKMLSCYPSIPLGGDMGFSSAVLSYNGVAHFAFCGYQNAITDIAVVEKLLATSFAELCKGAGVCIPRKQPDIKRKQPDKARSANESGVPAIPLLSEPETRRAANA